MENWELICQTITGIALGGGILGTLVADRIQKAHQKTEQAGRLAVLLSQLVHQLQDIDDRPIRDLGPGERLTIMPLNLIVIPQILSSDALDVTKHQELIENLLQLQVAAGQFDELAKGTLLALQLRTAPPSQYALEMIRQRRDFILAHRAKLIKILQDKRLGLSRLPQQIPKH